MTEICKQNHHCNMLKRFECPQCGSCFDRASQLDYHHRSIHLRERSQVCQICKKGFFRKTDLRTHLNIHMGTNFYICEFCGRQFSHVSNLIRHCRMHTGLKPYSCSICDKRFTQISSLVRHKQMIHGIPKETVHQYYDHSLISNKSQTSDHLLKENKSVKSVATKQQTSANKQCHCKSSGESSDCICSKALLRQYENHYSESIMLPEYNSCKKIIDNGTDNATENEFCMEQRYQSITTDPDVQKNEAVPDQHNINMDNKMCSSLSQTDDYIASKEFEESNLDCENTNQFSQDYFAEIEERLGSIDLAMNKTVVLNPPQDTVNNHEQIQAKDNVIYLHQFDKNNFIFLPRDRGPNVNALEAENYENSWRTSDLHTHMIQEACKEVSTNGIRTLNMDANLQTCNSDDVSVDQKLLYRQLCKDAISENKKCNKPLNDDVTQLYIELINSGMLKFDESRYCNNTDSDGVNLNHTIKSQHSTNIANKDAICTPVTMQNQDNLLHDEDNLDSFNNTNDVMSNNEKPMLRLVQTETGEQFYEFMISNLVEDMQNISCAEDLENEVEESINTFRHCQKLDSNSKGSNGENDQMEHQEVLESFAGINNEFNYTQFDFHGEEKNFTILCHDESERIQQDSRNNIYDNNVQEKNTQNYNTEHLELLEHESHVDFDKYVETNLEAFERLNYENCSEKFLEFVEVADIGIENSGCKEPSMVRLIQNDDGEQLLELLQDSQITGQESNQDFTVQTNDFDKDCSNILQDNNKTVDYSKSKSDFFTYVENNMSLEENINSNRSMENNNECIESSNNTFENIAIGEGTSNENSAKTSEEAKKPKATSKKFQCSVCKKAFSSAYNYKQHIGVHFTDQQKFHCKECGISFAWKTTFNKHIANNHSSDGPQKFVCEICPKVYSTLSQVNEHIKRDHLKERNHVCLLCGKSFFKKSDLKTHSRTHTDERPYVCRVCGKRFHHQSHIIRHERTHSGESPFVCDVCQKTFMQLSSLKAHKQKHQQVQVDFLDYQIDEDDPTALVTL
ncbi:zinc finger protein 28 homolog isoform X2 [Ooceraea biroi]|uniref:zinc finger protein 28 homolog isoform X2 n=1 Tax=Ooceraea biroi TaxID=2015173 RepID=UPI0005BB5747|nr:zinc finger protein 28 homolog isoform X2 [Ooceraea biroi]